MYLLAFTTVIIGVLAIYAQVLTVEAGQIAARNTSLANMMMYWHGAAISMGASIIDNPPGGGINVPCSLTYLASPPSGLPLCNPPDKLGVTTGDLTGTVTNSSALNQIINKAGTPEPVHLPPGYDMGLYQFYSILYYDVTNQVYEVATYVPRPANNPAPGFITLPTTGTLPGYTTGFTMGDLGRQLTATTMPLYGYGSVSGGKMATGGTYNQQQTTYNGPVYGGATYNNLPAQITDGSEAIISSPEGF